MSVEYKVIFVPAKGADFGAEEQSLIIQSQGKDGWEWHGFVTCSEPEAVHEIKGGEMVFVGAATRTAGTMLYFARRVKELPLGEAMSVPRAARRQAAREAVKIKGKAN
jgi:hypothetical protein